MRDDMQFWGAAALGDTPGRTRGERKQARAQASRKLGRHIAFGGKGSTVNAPAPDPQIGKSALENAEIAREQLAFAKEQFAKGEIRQDEYQKMIDRVVTADLGTQQEAKQWATQDRTAGQAANEKFNQFSDLAQQWGDMYAKQVDQSAAGFGKAADTQQQLAQSQLESYNKDFAPINARIASDAMNWDSAANQEAAAGAARADVLDAAQQQREASNRQMAAMGVNPNSGRFAGMSNAQDIATALGAAGAQNAARDNLRAQGISLRGQASGVGQQVLGNSQAATSLGLQTQQAQQGAAQNAFGLRSSALAQGQQAITAGLAGLGVGNISANTSLNAGSAAVGAGSAGNQNFYANQGAMNQGFGGAVGANQSAAGILNQQFGTQVSAANAQNAANAQASAGASGALGSVVGAGIMVF